MTTQLVRIQEYSLNPNPPILKSLRNPQAQHCTDKQMEKLYTHVSYIFLYFFFSSLLTTLILKKVLRSLASKNKQNIPPSLQTKSSRERLIASQLGIFIFTLHGGVLNTLPTFLGLLLIESLKSSSISVYLVFQGKKQ